MQVSHASRPNVRSPIRTASRFSTTGHHPGARPSAPAGALSGVACLNAAVCLATAASSAVRSPAAVRWSTVTVTIREWLPATSLRPGRRAFTGTVILTGRGLARRAAFHRLIVAIRTATRVSFTVAPGRRGGAGAGDRHSP